MAISALSLPNFSAYPLTSMTDSSGSMTANLTDELPQLMTKIMRFSLSKYMTMREREIFHDLAQNAIIIRMVSPLRAGHTTASVF